MAQITPVKGYVGAESPSSDRKRTVQIRSNGAAALSGVLPSASSCYLGPRCMALQVV
jgi:hypothetical protein